MTRMPLVRKMFPLRDLNGSPEFSRSRTADRTAVARSVEKRDLNESQQTVLCIMKTAKDWGEWLADYEDTFKKKN